MQLAPIVQRKEFVEERNRQITDFFKLTSAPVAEIKDYSIMSIDLVGSTKLSELMTQVEYAKLVTLVSVEITEAVNNYHGTILKYIGDGALAIFPHLKGEATQSIALECAQVIFDIVNNGINPELRKNNLPQVAFRIGIDTGEAVSILIGKKEAKNRDLIGTPVNIAAKIQSLAEPNEICLGESAVKFMPEDVKARLEKKTADWNYKNKEGKPYGVYCFKKEQKAIEGAQLSITVGGS